MSDPDRPAVPLKHDVGSGHHSLCAPAPLGLPLVSLQVDCPGVVADVRPLRPGLGGVMGEKKELRKRLRAAHEGQRVAAEKADRDRLENNALKDVVVRLNGENARLKEEVARLQRRVSASSASSAREFDIWNR